MHLGGLHRRVGCRIGPHLVRSDGGESVPSALLTRSVDEPEAPAAPRPIVQLVLHDREARDALVHLDEDDVRRVRQIDARVRQAETRDDPPDQLGDDRARTGCRV